MTTVLDDNVHNFGVDGSSDDLDVPIKVGMIMHTSKKRKDWRGLFFSPELLAKKVRKSRQQDYGTKMRLNLKM